MRATYVCPEDRVIGVYQRSWSRHIGGKMGDNNDAYVQLGLLFSPLPGMCLI
jgi:hypothetical protein